MDREYRKKYQVVFLIDKSLEHIKDFLNHRHDRFSQCGGSKPKGESQQQPSPRSTLPLCSSSNNVTSSCDCGTVEDIDKLKSRICKSISLSVLRILCYLFTKSIPRGSNNKKADADFIKSTSFTLNDEDFENNNEENTDKQTLADLKNQLEYLKEKQSSLQWGYKFFSSNKLPGKTEHHQLKDFKLRHFEEFEKELEKQFEELNDYSFVNTKTKPLRKNDPSPPGERRKSNGPSPSECLKRTLSHVLYDFNWENPDITSPVISRRSSLAPKKKRSSNSGIDGPGLSSSGPRNLVFLFKSCPSSKLELRHFAGKVVVDSEVLLDSFMPPSLFKEFVVSRNLSLYWVDHQIQDDIFHINVSDAENESFRVVNEALAKLGGTLIPLDSLTVTGSIHWSSIYYNTRWANHLFLDVNSPQQPSHFGNFLEKKSDNDDFPPVTSNDKANSKSKNKRSKYHDNGRGLFPVTSVLDHFIKGLYTSIYIKDGVDLIKKSQIEATFKFDQDEKQPELCPLTLVPTNSSNTGNLEKFFTCSQSSNPSTNIHVSMTSKHKKSKSESQPNVQFILSKPQPNTTTTTTTTSSVGSSSPILSTPQESISLQLEVYSYLSSSDVCSTSDYVFFCTACIQRGSKLNSNRKSDSPKSSLLNTYAKFQSLLLRLAEADQNLVLNVKLDGQCTPVFAVMQPLSVSLGLIVFFPMGLSLNFEKYLHYKSKQNVSKETNSDHTFQLEKDYLDCITHRFTKKIWHSKYIADTSDLQKSDVNTKKEVSKLNVFDSSVLNQWSAPRVNNPEMTKMSMHLGKNVAADSASCGTRETNLFKQLKTFYREVDSPSQLVNKKQQEEEEKKMAESMSEEIACQSTGEPKPRILQKLRSFTLGPTRAEMILSKSMQVVEQQSKVDKEDTLGMNQSTRMSEETESQVADVVKQLGDDSTLSNYIKGFYESTITENLNSWNRMHRIVAVVHAYMKGQGKTNPEAEAKKFLEEQVYLSSQSLRQKYQAPTLSIKKQDKILEYQLQIILRMEMLSYLKLSSEDDQMTNDDDDDDDEDEQEDSTVDIFVEEIVTMLRTLSFITDAAIVPVFLNDTLLKHYADTLTRPLADIYNELMQPLPSVLANTVESPESSIPSSFCPSTVSSSIMDETTRDGFPEVSATQAKRAKTMQVVPGLGEGVKRQIVVGKKPANTARQNNSTKDAKSKKKNENESKEKVRARRSLFMSEKKTLERHRSFAVRDKEKPRTHRNRRYGHRRNSKHSTVKSSSAQKSKTMVAETPAHKQLSHVMRRWHLLQNRLTEPMQATQSPSTEINETPKRAKSEMSVSIIEESPLKDGIPASKLAENCKKTTVLIRRGFYSSHNVKSQSRNLSKYLELADRIAGRHDRYAQLTDLSTLSQTNQGTQSPADKPSTFALSQLLGSPSSNSPKSYNSTVRKYTPNRKSPAFPFSTSPKFTSKTLERVSVKQALFRTPEKTIAKSQTLVLQSPDVTSPNSSSTKNLSSVRSKFGLFNSPPNGSKCIFKTPTKEPECIFKSPDKTPTFKRFTTTPVKSISQTLKKFHNQQSDVKCQSSSTLAVKSESSNNKAKCSKTILKSQDLRSAKLLKASRQLSSTFSFSSETPETAPAECPKSSDHTQKISLKNIKFNKLIYSQDDNNNSTLDTSSVIPLHSNPLKSLPPVSLCSDQSKLRKRSSRHLKALQPDSPCENKDSSLASRDNISSTSTDECRPLTKQKRKKSESVSDISPPLRNKRQRRSLNYTSQKPQDTKEGQKDTGSLVQSGNIIHTQRTRRSTVIRKI